MSAATTLAMAGISVAGSAASFVQAGQQQDHVEADRLPEHHPHHRIERARRAF